MKRPLAPLPEGMERSPLTPEREATILAVIDRNGGQSPTGPIAKALDKGVSHVMVWLYELVDRGTLRRYQVQNRSVYERADVTIDERYVVEAYKPLIRAWLLGRRELPGAIARGTGLKAEVVAETCKAMMVAGELVGTAVGASWIFAHDIRGTTRTDPEAAARVAPSPEALFQESLRKASRRPEPALVGTSKGARVARAVVPRVPRTPREPATPRLPKPPRPPRAPREPKAPRPPRPPAAPKASAAERRRQDWAARGLIGREEAATLLHINRGELQRWITQHPEVNDLVVEGRPAAVHQELLTRYRAAHTPAGATWQERAPHGWILPRAAMEQTGLELPDLLRRLAAGEVSAVKTDRELVFDPARLIPAETAFLAVETVARYLHDDPDRLRRLARAGHLPSIRSRGGVRITIQSVRGYRPGAEPPAQVAPATPRPRPVWPPRVPATERRAAERAAAGRHTPREAAALLHTSTTALNRWILAHPELHHLVQGGAHPSVHNDFLSAYRAAHTPAGATWAAQAPEGFLPALDAGSALELTPPELLAVLALGVLRAVKTDEGLWFDPGTLALPDDAPLPLIVAARRAGIGARQLRGLLNRGRIPHQGVGPEALVTTSDARAYRLRQRAPVSGHRQLHARAALSDSPATGLSRSKEGGGAPPGFHSVGDASDRLGINAAALYKWLEQHDEARARCRKPGKYLWVPESVLVDYAAASLPPGATFATAVPADWPDIWGAVERVGWSYTKLYKMLAQGRVTAVQSAGKLWFDPASLDRLRAELDAEEAVPEGWVAVQALAGELGGLDKASVVSWVKRRGFELRISRDAARQNAAWISPDAAAAYRAHRVAIPGGIKLTPAVRLAILQALPPKAGRRRPSGTVAAVAARHGVSTASVRNLLRDTAPEAHLEAWTQRPSPEPDEVATDAGHAPVPDGPPAPRPVVTLALEQQLRAELPPARRRIPGETARVAARHGLSVNQVRNALARIPSAPLQVGP